MSHVKVEKVFHIHLNQFKLICTLSSALPQLKPITWENILKNRTLTKQWKAEPSGSVIHKDVDLNKIFKDKVAIRTYSSIQKLSSKCHNYLAVMIQIQQGTNHFIRKKPNPETK